MKNEDKITDSKLGNLPSYLTYDAVLLTWGNAKHVASVVNVLPNMFNSKREYWLNIHQSRPFLALRHTARRPSLLRLHLDPSVCPRQEAWSGKPVEVKRLQIVLPLKTHVSKDLSEQLVISRFLLRARLFRCHNEVCALSGGCITGDSTLRRYCRWFFLGYCSAIPQRLLKESGLLQNILQVYCLFMFDDCVSRRRRRALLIRRRVVRVCGRSCRSCRRWRLWGLWQGRIALMQEVQGLLLNSVLLVSKLLGAVWLMLLAHRLQDL